MKRVRKVVLFVSFVFILLLSLGAAAEVGAQTVSIEEINEVAKELWCPLCNGVRLDTCELQACEQMRQEIAIKLAEGATKEEIKQYFVEQYGPVVLGEPPSQGWGLVGWGVAVVGLLVGLAVLVYLIRQWSLRQTSVAVPANSLPGDSPRSSDVDDVYLARVQEELKDF
ncbi:MAG TPA: hypothetical protein EYP04_03395 [Anaerolineae bacterium]|nr:hypothetical protein [Anaerolineae bacterium]